MKRLRILCLGSLILLISGISVAFASAQDQKPALAGKEAMKKLGWMVGQWKGEGWMEMGPGQRRTFTQTEAVQSKLDGLVLLIEGLGKGKAAGQEDATIHNALGLISYDVKTQRYRFRADTAEGRSIEVDAKVSPQGELEWGFQVPPSNSIRYTLKPTAKNQWSEIGEMSQDGKTWRMFFEMTLERVK